MKYMLIIDINGYKFYSKCFNSVMLTDEAESYLNMLEKSGFITKSQRDMENDRIHNEVIEMLYCKRDVITSKYLEIVRVK